MKKLFLAALCAASLVAAAQRNVYKFEVEDAQGGRYPLASLRGKVALVVNTATQCGFTPQYAPLQELYAKYAGRGFVVLDFPCNQFGGQAPGTADEIAEFCELNYHTTFPQMAKVEVNGPGTVPLFAYLKRKQGFHGFGTGRMAELLDGMMRKQDAAYDKNPDIKWNFTKFLIDKRGRVVRRFEPTEDMSVVEAEVVRLLDKK
ncbi:MAG: glutathione peroxidase [Alloprevotella sp.]|nr:glutathione peroxidase [Alloprevotella sp.]